MHTCEQPLITCHSDTEFTNVKIIADLILDLLFNQLLTVDLADGYTTNDIIYEWSHTGVVVGNSEMAQFEYKSNNISSSIEEFSVGKYKSHKNRKSLWHRAPFN